MITLSAIIAGDRIDPLPDQPLPIGQRDYLIEAVQVGIIEMVMPRTTDVGRGRGLATKLGLHPVPRYGFSLAI